MVEAPGAGTARRAGRLFPTLSEHRSTTMATHRSQRDNADAFDDLLGQLVDELAMRPTMVPEPEPEPEPAPPVAVAPVLHHVPMAEPVAPRSNVMGLAIGGGIAVAGIAIAFVLMGRAEPPQPVAQPVVAAVTPAPQPAKPVVAPAPVVAALPVAPPVGLPAGTGLPGQVVDPAALAQATPAGADPARGSATPAAAPKKVVKKTVAPKKTEPSKPKVVDPFD
jgi:hypothetical protein